MKTYILVGLLVIQSIILYAQKADVDKMVLDFLINPKKANVSNLTENDRDELVRQLHLYVEGKLYHSTPSEYRSEALFLLIRLNDSDTVSKFMSAYNDEAKETGVVSDYIGYIAPRLPGYRWEDAAQPSLIPQFAEYLPFEDGNKIGFQGGDSPYFVAPQSIGSASIILGTIKNCADFETPTRDWAQKMYLLLNDTPDIVSVSEFRKIMVDWWSANKEFFDKKDYKSVKPGADLHLATLASPAPEVSPLQTVAPPQPSAAPETSSAPATEKDSTKSPSWPYAAIIVIVLIGTVGFLFVWQRKK